MHTTTGDGATPKSGTGRGRRTGCGGCRAIAFVGALVLAACGARGGAAADADREALDRFEREVRPVLARACVGCHGPKKQEGGLRVDSRGALVRGGDRGPAIVPGDAGKSLLVAALRHEGELRMPPEKPLDATSVAALRRWIDAGAAWPDEAVRNVVRGGPITDDERRHWSLQPVRATALPDMTRGDWSITAIDRFVLDRLEAERLAPAPDADRATLLRRLRLLLTGLPPTLDEQQEFASDEAPDAVARRVDRLLAEPAHGERWGRHWLDVVRYADTAGDGADYPVREAYLYRNYVIRSLAADKPYDQFVREQLAGDLLAAELDLSEAGAAERYAELVTATGYLAVAKRFGYNVNTDFQHLDLADVIEGVGRSLLGLSIGCARCHDHKYDPVNMADYYAWYGIFASSRFSFPGGEEHKRPAFLAPLVPPAEAQTREAARQAETAELQRRVREAEERRGKLAARLVVPNGGDLAFETSELGKPPAAPWFQAGPNRIAVEAQSPFTDTYVAGRYGVRMESGTPHDGVRWELKTPVVTAPGGRLHVHLDFRNVTSVPNGGAYRLYLGDGAIRSLGVELGVSSDDVAVRDGGAWRSVGKIETGAWYGVRLTIDLEKKTYSGRIERHGAAENEALVGNALVWKDAACAPGWNGRIDTFFCDGLGHREGPRPTRDLDNLALQTTPIAAPAAVESLAPDVVEKTRRELAEVEATLGRLKAESDSLAKRPLYPVAYAVAEGKPANVRIQKRGEPDRPGDEAPRRNLEILGGEPLAPDVAARASGRRELAEWIVRPSNPLVPRVIVNRAWQHLFGAGLVATESDFGTRGETPSHPELLDHLAARFVASGWSLKRLQRELVLSRAWRQSSDAAEESVERDPTNRWLSRFARRPLDAESIRDGMLWASDGLNRAMPGPHPFPPVESWGFTIHYPFEGVYDSPHRSVYLMVQRQRKQPYLSLFDGADPNISTARRTPTTTPVQALYLLNSEFVHHRSAELARRLLAEQADEAARIGVAFGRTWGRRPSDAEIEGAREFLRRYREQAVGAGVTDVEQAAWSGLARGLFAGNGFLFVE